MKLRKLKSILDKMSKEQLNQNLIVLACDKTLSGHGVVRKAKGDLIWNGDDDPCELMTKSVLIEEGYEKGEIEEMDTMVNKGEFYIELP